MTPERGLSARLQRRGQVHNKLGFTVDQEWPYGDMRLAYLSNGAVKVEILGGWEAGLQSQPTDLAVRRRAFAPLLHSGR